MSNQIRATPEPQIYYGPDYKKYQRINRSTTELFESSSEPANQPPRASEWELIEYVRDRGDCILTLYHAELLSHLRVRGDRILSLYPVGFPTPFDKFWPHEREKEFTAHTSSFSSMTATAIWKKQEDVIISIMKTKIEATAKVKEKIESS